MNSESKRNARLVLIWAAKMRADCQRRENPGAYWKEVLRHYILDARCMNSGEPIPASRW